MAGKVAQIRELMAGDNLARQLSGLYNNWWIQRREKELEWRELRNYLFATSSSISYLAAMARNPEFSRFCAATNRASGLEAAI